MAWGDDGLHKRGDRWYISYRDAKGRPREKSTGRTDYRAAVQARCKFMEALEEGQLPNDMASWPLQTAVDKYLEWRQATRPRSSGVEKTQLRQVVKFFGPAKKLASFTDRDLRDYQVHRSRTVSPTMKRPVQPRSINYELWCLRRILEQANLWRGPLRDRYRRLPQPRARCGKALSPEVGARLFAVAMQEPAWEVAFLCALLAYSTGCRSWEIKTLKLGAIDLEADELTVQAEYAKNRQERFVALNAISRWALERLIARAQLLGANDPEHFLLPHHRTKHTRESDPQRGGRGFDPTRHQTSWASAWRRLRTRADLSTFRFHDLRHTFNTQGAEAGVSVEILMAQVGHIDPEMCRHYTHISSKAKHKAAQIVAERNPQLLSLLASMNSGMDGTKIQ